MIVVRVLKDFCVVLCIGLIKIGFFMIKEIGFFW